MAAVLGLDAKLYARVLSSDHLTPCSYGTAQSEWVELTNVRDNTLDMTKGDADVTTRANNGWKATIGTLKDGTIDFEMIWDGADNGFKIMKTAFLENKVCALLIMDGSRTATPAGASQGLMVNCSITKFSRPEPLEDALKAQVTARPTYVTGQPPVWVESDPTFTSAEPPNA
jgi:hypothetical protein